MIKGGAPESRIEFLHIDPIFGTVAKMAGGGGVLNCKTK